MATRLLELLPTGLFGDEAIPTSLSGREEMSGAFEFFLSIASPKAALKPEEVIGQPLAVRIDRGDEPPRFIHGYVSHLWAGDFSKPSEKTAPSREYRVRLVPWVWFMTRAARCFIYLPEKLEKSLQEVLDELIKRVKSYGHVQTWNESGAASILKSRKVEHCVQYRETDFNFLSRTLEQYGVYYYFRHESDKHTLVLSDQMNYPDAVESKLEYHPSESGDIASDTISSWEHAYEFVSGKSEQTDYDFLQPSTSLKVNAAKHSAITLGNNSGYELYDFPGEYSQRGDGESEVVRRQEEEEARFNTVLATSCCKTLSAGHCFKLAKHHSCSDEEGQSYLITAIAHSATQPGPFTDGGEPRYSNHFTCIPKGSQFRPPRRTARPSLASVQTAVVVGPAGEEIYTDEYGRVKVQFHWDREGKRDENTSCWMRVAQVHAGKGFGGIDIPRVGEEVVVSFIEGDMDRPLVTGRLYHKESMPPFGLPGSKTISGIKTKTYKGSGYNELAMDDTPDNELIRVHAQYDMDTTVEHDKRTTVHNNRAATIDVDDTESVGSNQSIDIGANQNTIVGVDQNLEVGANQKESIGATREISVTADDLLTVSGQQKIGVTGPIEISSDASITLTVGGCSIKIEPTGITVKAAASLLLESGGQLEAKGAMVTSQATAVNEVKGATVKLN